MLCAGKEHVPRHAPTTAASRSRDCIRLRQPKLEAGAKWWGRDVEVAERAAEWLREVAAPNRSRAAFYLHAWFASPHAPVPFAVPRDAVSMLAARFEHLRVDEGRLMREPDMRCKLGYVHAMRRAAAHPNCTGDAAACSAGTWDVGRGLATYLGEVHGLDRAAGRLLDTLDSLSLRESTITVFTSDHGPAPLVGGTKLPLGVCQDCPTPGRHQASPFAYGRVHPHSGTKHTHFEGGLRVPFLIRWPGHLSEGKIDSSSVLSHADWLPTVASFAGVPLTAAEGRSLSGTDAWPVLLGRERGTDRTVYWQTRPDKWRGVRRGDLKLIWPGVCNGRSEYCGQPCASLRPHEAVWSGRLKPPYLFNLTEVKTCT